MKSRIGETVDSVVKKNLSDAKNLPERKNAKQADKGRPLELGKIADVAGILARTISKATIRKLFLIDESSFMAAVREVELRLAGQRATVDMAVGTFLEVIGPDHPMVLEIRSRIRQANITNAIESHTLGEAVFVQAGSAVDLTSARATAGTLDAVGDGVDFYWREGTNAPPAGDFDGAVHKGGKSPKEADAHFFDLVTRRLANLDSRRIREIRDLTIDGSKFCDRAVLLELKGGKWLLLVTEEYKCPHSGGGRTQTAIRDVRMFNKDVRPDSRFTYFDDAGTPVEILLKDLLVNFGAAQGDTLLVKAGRTQRGHRRRPEFVWQELRDRMKHYGVTPDTTPRDGSKKKPKKNQPIDFSFQAMTLAYPAREVRAFFQALWQDSKRVRR